MSRADKGNRTIAFFNLTFVLLYLTATKTGWQCWCWDFYISSFVFSKLKSPALPKEDVSLSFWKMKSSRDSKAKAAGDFVPPHLLVDDLSKICSSGSIYFLSLFWSLGCWLAAFLQRGNRRWRLHSYPPLCLHSLKKTNVGFAISTLPPIKASTEELAELF